jgi:hypothetical protein
MNLSPLRADLYPTEFAAKTRTGGKPVSLALLGYERQMKAWHEKDGRPMMPFLDVTGERALSFHGLSMGETPGPERRRGEQREGAELPRR